MDLPRLRQVGINVVGLTIATRFPGLRGTLSAPFFRSQGMPADALRTNMAIAGWLLDRIDGWVAESAGRLRIVGSAADLDACLAVGGPVGIFLGVQGGHVLDGDLANVERLARRGVRMLAPAHVMDNALVGSGTGAAAGGLTAYGRDAIAHLEAQGVIVDLAHMSIGGIEQALPLLHRPFALSHTGLTDASGGRSRWRRYSPATRNIPASLASQVAAAGGLVGIVLSTDLLGGSTPGAFVRTVALAVESAGPAAVGLGSDMDGALRMLVDVEGLPALAHALLQSGMGAEVTRGVMGGNAAALLRAALPA